MGRSHEPVIGEEGVLSSDRRRAGTDGAALSRHRVLCRSVEDGFRSSKDYRFKLRLGNERRRRVAVPQAAKGEVVMNRFWGLVGWVFGSASIPGDTKRMGVQIYRNRLGLIGEARRDPPVYGRARDDLNEQSDKRKRRTETPAGSGGSSAQRPRQDNTTQTAGGARRLRRAINLVH